MSDTFNILAIGDIVGKPGRGIIRDGLSRIRESHGIDMVIANGENAAGGMSITPAVTNELLSYGVDVVTTGNHVWNNKEIESIIDTEPRLLRPANYPEGVPGKGYCLVSVGDIRVCVINLMGRLYLNPIDCPFRKFDAIWDGLRGEAHAVVVDFHAEATSEKRAFGWYAAGRASAVYGTHTHVQTSDEEVLPGGTGYLTDAGMTGSFNSVIGMEKEKSIRNFLSFTRIKFDVAAGNVKLNGVIFRLMPDGRCAGVSRLIYDGKE